jgi:uncharacterized protein (DUF433 family)
MRSRRHHNTNEILAEYASQKLSVNVSHSESGGKREVARGPKRVTARHRTGSYNRLRVSQVDSAETIERVPIHTDADGVVRVAGTRVTLDTIVGAFEAGATAEEVAQQYPTVPLVDVYSVITYYLRHKSEVDAYLKERNVLAERVREEVERRFPSTGIRERLLARRK